MNESIQARQCMAKNIAENQFKRAKSNEPSLLRKSIKNIEENEDGSEIFTCEV